MTATSDIGICSLQPLAVVGVSSTGQGFGTIALKELRKAGIEAYAVNPKGGEWKGERLYESLRMLPKSAQAAVILTRGAGALKAVDECAQAGVKSVWLQGGSNTAEIRKRCSELKLEALHGECVLMRVSGFPHSLHRFFHDLFSRRRD
ncbi:MAG TPA: CoA-binding protein [bacterium]|jgi:predicted CoA-binding protein